MSKQALRSTLHSLARGLLVALFIVLPGSAGMPLPSHPAPPASAPPATTASDAQVLTVAALQGAEAGAFMPARIVSLPFNWDQVRRGVAGEATLDLVFRLRQNPVSPYALLFPRVGNRAEVWLNNVLLARFGEPDQPNGDDYAKSPHYVLIPSQLLVEDNLIRVQLWADAGRKGGLAPVTLGPDLEIRNEYTHLFRTRIYGPLSVAAFSLLVGMLSLALWLTQDEALPGARRQRPRLYFWAGVSQICWAARLGDTILVSPPLPWPYWGVLYTLTQAGWFCGAALFCHHVAGWNRHPSMIWFRLVVALLFVSAVPASMLAFSYGVLQVLTWWYGMAILLFIVYAKVYMVGALRQRRAEPIMAGAAGSLNVLVGVRDWWVVRAGGNFGEVAWVRYSSVLFGLALFVIVVMRFRAASAQARDLLATLAARVQEKERELARSYRELELMAREQERVAERSRILRDMHDGVGAHISAAIHQLQSGPVVRDELLQTLRDSLDHLKLSIDAMNLPPGDLNVLLAGLRYRLEPRLRAAGITLVWEVALLQPLSWLDSRGMRHLQFMVFEIVSNVLQHAQASTLRFELRATPGGGALLALVDNGRGFPPERDPSQGLRTLRQRAQALGASLEVRTSPGRTEVMVRLQAPLLTIVPT